MTPKPQPAPYPLQVLWRDEHLIAIYKPAGWLVHRTGLDAGETRFIVQTLRDQLGQHVWPLHRLDKGTCGVLLLALHTEAARRTAPLFEQHALDKRYLALVRGYAPAHCEVNHAMRPDDAPPNAPVQDAHTRLTRLAHAEWPEAYDPRFAGTRVSLVMAQPTTGRRHQIRRHLKHVAHPILGDATHGKGPLNRWWAERLGQQRLWLHAWSLRFTHPYDDQPVQVNSPVQLPKEWQALQSLQASDTFDLSQPTPLTSAHNPGPNDPSASDWARLFQRLPWEPDRSV